MREFFATCAPKTLLVAPSPALADELGQKVDSVTIGRLISVQLSHYCPKFSMKKKADALLELSTIWFKFFPGRKVEEFFYIYELLSELRSFTLNFDLVSEIIDRVDETTKLAVKIFWKYFEDTNIVDESKGYELLSQVLCDARASKQEKQKSYIFAGFNFFSGVQIDYLKILGRVADVCILIPEIIYHSARPTDWPSWLGKNDDEVNILKLSDLDELNSKAFNDEAINVVYFHKNHLAITLKKYMDGQGQLPLATNVVLASSEVEFSQVNELPFVSATFKVTEQIFEHKFRAIFEKLDSIIFSSGESLSVAKYQQIVDELLTVAQKKEDYRQLKILLVIKKVSTAWEELSESNKNISLEVNRLIATVVQLELPRTSHVNFTANPKVGKVMGVNEYSLLDNQAQNIVCVTSDYPKISAADSFRFDEAALSSLAAIGPIKSGDLSNKIVKFKIEELLTKGGGVLFIERRTACEIVFWQELIDSFPTKIKIIPESNLFLSMEVIAKKQHLTGPLDSIKFSASRLQSYIDCPRKYYFQYIKHLDTEVDLPGSFTSAELGSLEHEVITAFFASSTEQQNIRELSINAIARLEKEKQKKIDQIYYKQILQEIMAYAQNGINFLAQLLESMPGLRLNFAYKIAGDILHSTGEIDCLLTDSQGKIRGIIDFKRGASSIPAATELISFEKIQLWFYSHAIGPIKHEDLVLWGYLCLSNLEKSLIYSADTATINFASGLDFKIREIKSEEWQKLLQDYQHYEQEKRQTCQVDQEMLANPLSEKSCSYCLVNKFCESRLR